MKNIDGLKLGHGWNKGKKGVQKHSEATRKKMSDANKKRIAEGRHNFWKGGIAPISQVIRRSIEYKLWRKAIFERDKYTCKFCGAKNGTGKTITLQADHIKPFSLFPELRFALDNGRTLCRDCHKKTDTYGRGSLFRN